MSLHDFRRPSGLRPLCLNPIHGPRPLRQTFRGPTGSRLRNSVRPFPGPSGFRRIRWTGDSSFLGGGLFCRLHRITCTLGGSSRRAGSCGPFSMRPGLGSFGIRRGGRRRRPRRGPSIRGRSHVTRMTPRRPPPCLPARPRRPPLPLPARRRSPSVDCFRGSGNGSPFRPTSRCPARSLAVLNPRFDSCSGGWGGDDDVLCMRSILEYQARGGKTPASGPGLMPRPVSDSS